MKRFFLFMIAITVFTSNLIADELDDLIRSGLEESLSGLSISNSLMTSILKRKSSYYTLIPGLSLSADADYDTSTGGGFDFDVTLSESFSDVDNLIQTLRMADITLDMAYLQAEIDAGTLVKTIINEYAALAVFHKEREIALANISNQTALLKIMAVKFKNGDEIAVNLRKLSNEVEISRQELVIDAINFTNSLKSFRFLCAAVPEEYSIEPVDIETTNAAVYQLKHNYYLLEISNNLITRGYYNRQHFLPKLSVSYNWGFDALNGTSTAGAGVSLDFTLSDIFERKNKIAQLDIDTAELETDIAELLLDWENDLQLMETTMTLLENKIALLQNDVQIETELRRLYNYQYETDQIDYYDYRLLMSDLLNAELDLLEARADLYVLLKRLQYGIIDPN